MARQVYYDPFGNRTAGYQAGLKDEVTLQDQTRRARNSDWDHRNMDPLRLQGAQRMEQFNQFADPYLRRGLGLQERMTTANAFATEAPIYAEEARISGDPSGALARMGLYTSGQYLDPNNTYLAHRDYRQSYGLNDPSLDQPGWSQEIAQRYGIDPLAYAQSHQRMPMYSRDTTDSALQRYLEDAAYKKAEFDANQGWRQHQMNRDVATHDRSMYGTDMRYAGQQLRGQGQAQNQPIFDPAMHGFGLPQSSQYMAPSQQGYMPQADEYDTLPQYLPGWGPEGQTGGYTPDPALPTPVYNPTTGQFESSQDSPQAYGPNDYAQDF